MVDNVPVFNGVTDYTRRGDFQVNANGDLGQRRRLLPDGRQCRPQDRQSDRQRSNGSAVSEQLHPGPGDQCDLKYAANLPTKPNTQASTASAAGTITAAGGLYLTGFATNPQCSATSTSAPPATASW